jgi:hypothetical protein
MFLLCWCFLLSTTLKWSIFTYFLIHSLIHYLSNSILIFGVSVSKSHIMINIFLFNSVLNYCFIALESVIPSLKIVYLSFHSLFTASYADVIKVQFAFLALCRCEYVDMWALKYDALRKLLRSWRPLSVLLSERPSLIWQLCSPARPLSPDNASKPVLGCGVPGPTPVFVLQPQYRAGHGSPPCALPRTPQVGLPRAAESSWSNVSPTYSMQQGR